MGQSCCCGRVKEDWPEPEFRSPPPTFRKVKAEVTREPEGVADVEASLVEEDLPKSPKMLASPAATPEKAQEPQQTSKEAVTQEPEGVADVEASLVEVTQEPEGVADVEASLVEEDLLKFPKMLASPAATPEKAQEPQKTSKEASTLDGVGLGPFALLSDGGPSAVAKALSGGKAPLCKESQRQVSESTQASQHCVDQVDHGYSHSDVD